MEKSISVHKVDLFSTDLYQFTCSYAYFLAGTHEDIATFEVFFRKHPFKGQFAICGESRRPVSSQIHLKSHNNKQPILRALFLICNQNISSGLKRDSASRTLKLNVNIRFILALSEGEIVFAKEPIITYTGPLGIVQLLQTPLLNLIGFASLVATNASRMVKAASSKTCVQFGIRRAQGPDGALSASHYSYLGGFSGTSNVQASMIFDIPCQGTMSHAFITSFSNLSEIKPFQFNGINIPEKALAYRKQFGFTTHDGQLAAFLNYSRAFSNRLVALIDTYSTMDSGILNTIVVGKALIAAGVKQVGIRLDSGDLCEYSKKVRKVWDKYVPESRLKIVASDDLNEQRILNMEKQGSQIDVYAIGTNIATCQKQPALGLVCKLVELNNIPRMKFSENADKATYPAKKSVYRVWIKDQETAKFDLIALEGQNIGDQIVVCDSSNHLKKYEVKVFRKQQLNKQWKDFSQKKLLKQSRDYLQRAKKTIPQEVFHLETPKKYPIMLTEKYRSVLQTTLNLNIVLKKLE